MIDDSSPLAHAYHQRLGRFVSDEEIGDWRMKFYGLAGCVWELGIVEFERRAWIADVIGNPDGPDVDRHMGRRFDGLI